MAERIKIYNKVLILFFVNEFHKTFLTIPYLPLGKKILIQIIRFTWFKEYFISQYVQLLKKNVLRLIC